MNYQHIENLLIRYRGQAVDIKTMSGGVYEGTINDVTNDYVALKLKGSGGGEDVVFILLHAIESVLPQRAA
jgi:ferredoxin-fold anticodon binding domain-containing protein